MRTRMLREVNKMLSFSSDILTLLQLNDLASAIIKIVNEIQGKYLP